MISSYINPSIDDALLYLKCLISLAKADGRIDPREKNYIQLQAELYEVDLSDLWDYEFNATKEELLRLSKLAKIFILRDLIILSYIDDEFHYKEREMIEELAKQMEIDTKKISELEDWLKKYIQLLEASIEIFK